MKIKHSILALAAVAALAAGSAQAQTSVGYPTTAIGTWFGTWSGTGNDCDECGSGRNAIASSGGSIAIAGDFSSDNIAGDKVVAIGTPTIQPEQNIPEVKADRRAEILLTLRADLMGAYSMVDHAKRYSPSKQANGYACYILGDQAEALVDQAAGAYFQVVEWYRAREKSWMEKQVNQAAALIAKANTMTTGCAGEYGVERAKRMVRLSLEHPRPIAEPKR